ncbi:MAG: hypothetical protein E6I76_01940 [Chloroflexi bacterium]|nr:MAG: hypothetical protein E6I76_01940 [Chloroflexota bacterium]
MRLRLMAMIGLVLAVAGTAAMNGGDVAAKSRKAKGTATPFTAWVQPAAAPPAPRRRPRGGRGRSCPPPPAR